MENYAGDPTNYPLTVGIPDDSDPPNESTFGVAPENLADRTAWLRAHVGTVSVNWSPLTFNNTATSESAFPYFGTCTPVWSSGLEAWVTGGGQGVGDILISTDGQDWIALLTGASLLSSILGIATNPDNGDVVGLVTGDGTGEVVKISQTATLVYIQESLTWLDAQYDSAYINDKYVVWARSNSTAPAYSAGTDGLTWTLATGWSVPSGYTHGVSAISPSAILIFPAGSNVSSYILSTDGVSWADNTLPSVSSATTIVGAGYDDVRNKYVYGASNSSTNETLIYVSDTGLTSSWIVQYALPYTSVSLAVVNGEISVFGNSGIRQFDLDPAENGSTNRIQTSSDGGLTWRSGTLFYFLAGTLIAGQDSLLFFTPGGGIPGYAATKRI